MSYQTALPRVVWAAEHRGSFGLSMFLFLLGLFAPVLVLRYAIRWGMGANF